MKALRAVLLLACCVVSVSAAAKPNLTGTWKMNSGKSHFASAGPTSIVLKFDQTETTLDETLTISGDNGDHSVQFKYTLDGKEGSGEIEGDTIKTVAKWDGESLVLLWTAPDHGSFQRKMTLDPDGKTLKMDVHHSDDSGEGDDSVVLEKQ